MRQVVGFNGEPELGWAVVALKVSVSLVKMILWITGYIKGFSQPISAFLACVKLIDENLDGLLIEKQLSEGRTWLWRHVCGFLPRRFVNYISGKGKGNVGDYYEIV